MPDGSHEPDYTMIEFGAVAAFTVIVNETDVPDNAIREAYRGLTNLETMLQATRESDGPLNLAVIDGLLADAVPIEYRALATMGSQLIRERAQLYLGEHLSDAELGKYAIVGKIAEAVVSGAKAALEPRARQLQRGKS